MHEHFDDSIRRQLEGLESPVPKDIFDAIRSQPDMSDATFDAGLRHRLQSAESPAPTGLFDKLNAGADLDNATFDGFVQQQLSTHPSPVPADMWSRIMKEKDRRRPVVWWWVAASLIFLLSGGTWYAVQHNSIPKAVFGKKMPPEKNEQQQEATFQRGDATVVKKQAAPVVTDTSQAVIFPSPDTTSSKQSDVAKTSPSYFSNNTNTTVKKRVIEKRMQTQHSYSVFSKNAKNKVLAYGNADNPGKQSCTSTSSAEIILNNNGDVMEVMPATAELSTISLNITQQLRSAARLLPGQLLKAKPRLPEIPCPIDKYSRRNNWYVDIYSSAFLVDKTISDKTAGKNAKTGFDSTLHRQVSFNAGINVVKNIGKNVLLKTGVQYNQVNETFRLTRINERKLVTIVSVRTVIITPGDTVYIRDTSVTEQIGTIQRRTQNKLKQWDVPVIIGYEFGGESIRLNANAGIIANIRSAYTGDMIADTTQQVINANDYNGKPVYKTNVGISLYTGLTIVKPLGRKTSLLIEPYARIGLKNIAAEQAWFGQKNNTAGISVGLRYQLDGGRQRR